MNYQKLKWVKKFKIKIALKSYLFIITRVLKVY